MMKFLDLKRRQPVPKYFIQGVRADSAKVEKDNDKGLYELEFVEASIISSAGRAIAKEKFGIYPQKKLENLSEATKEAMTKFMDLLAVDCAKEMGLAGCDKE